MNKQKLGHYQLLNKIGSGGMGEVYLAQDEKLNRQVALKVLPPEMSVDPEKRSRFEREAKAVAALAHPNIVHIYSVEEDAGTHFLTMELVEGRTLANVIPEGGLSLDQIFDLAIPALDAVSFAHEKGIAHRDLKPENIMISDKGHVKVLDFGLAKLVAGTSVEAGLTLAVGKAQTEEGRILGTVSYMSPEQAEGKRVDQRTDIFSMGIILYEMATGKQPFQRDSSLSTLSAILRDQPPPISQMRQELPNHLGRIIQRCLAKDPRERYQTALDVKNELTLLKRESSSNLAVDRSTISAAVSTPAAARSDSGSESRVHMDSGRRSWLPWVGGAAMVAILAVVWFVLSSRSGNEQATSSPDASRASVAETATNQKKSMVIFPFENLGAPEDAYFAAGMTEELTSRLAIVGGLSVMSRTSAVQYDKTGKTMPQIGKDLGVDYVLEGTVRWERRNDGSSRVRVSPQLIRTADDSHVWAERYDRSMEEIFKVQSEIAEEVVRSLQVTLNPAQQEVLESKPTENMEAYHAYLRGWDLVERDYQEKEWSIAITMFERAVALDPGFHQALFALSRTHSGFSHFAWDRSPERLAKAKETADMAMKLDPDSPWSYMALGYYHYWGKKEYEPALRAFLTAEEKLGNNPEVLEAIANVKRRQGDFERALDYYRRAMDVDPRNSGKVYNVAETFSLVHDYAEADRVYEMLISLSPDLPMGYTGRAWNLIRWKGDVEKAREVLASCPVSEGDVEYDRFWAAFNARDFSSALRHASRCPRVEGGQHDYNARSLLKGWAYAYSNLPQLARAEFDSARVLFEDLAAKDPQNARIRGALGHVYAGLGRKQDAIREGRAALDLFPEAKDAWIYLSRLRDLALIHAAVGEQEAAIDILEDLINRQGNVASPALLRISPFFDSLRENPSFQELVEQPL